MHPIWNKIEVDRATVDKRSYERPCLLFSAHLTAGSGGAATAVIRDGHETTADPIIDLSAPQSSVDARNFFPPIPIKKGLYIDVGSNVTSVIVQFLPLKDQTE